jgi:hypothetical protein
MLHFGNLANNKSDHKPTRTKHVTRRTETYQEKLDQERTNDFTPDDLCDYFEDLYEAEFGIRKDYNRGMAIQIIYELLNDFEMSDLVDCLEFVFLSDQTELDREKFGFGSLKVKRWVNYIERNMGKFLNGESVQTPTKTPPSAPNKRSREWAKRQTGGIKFELPNRFF